MSNVKTQMKPKFQSKKVHTRNNFGLNTLGIELKFEIYLEGRRWGKFLYW